jgi:hypothetical protein
MTKASRKLHSVKVSGRHRQYRRVAQGLSNAPATFQCLFIKVLISMLFSNEFVYIDDVLLMANNFKSNWRQILQESSWP